MTNEPMPEPKPTKDPKRIKPPKKQIVALVILGCSVLCIAAAVFMYSIYSHRHPSTNDAYLHADTIYVAARVSGKITDILVSDYQHVEKGELLFHLDPIPYKLMLTEAKAKYQLALQLHGEQSAGVSEAAANVEKKRAEFTEAQREYKRIKSLFDEKLVAQQKFDQVKTRMSAAEADSIAAEAFLEKAISARGGKGMKAAVITQAASELARAELNLNYTRVSAAFSGFVGEIKFHAGSVVNAAQPLFPMIKDDSFWVRGNFKETDIERIKAGQPARIELDMYPGEEFEGVVTDLSTATGAAFSLLPPENATGNWIKTTQRLPIKVQLKYNKHHPQMRVGASAMIKINTTVGLEPSFKNKEKQK